MNQISLHTISLNRYRGEKYRPIKKKETIFKKQKQLKITFDMNMLICDLPISFLLATQTISRIQWIRETILCIGSGEIFTGRY